MGRAGRDVAVLGAGYALGSIPFGLWLGRARAGLDVRDHGSGSMGATNVLRTLGPATAAATFGLDIAKGSASVWVGRRLRVSGAGEVAAGLGAVIGHSWPVFAHFRGGKSVATAFGGLLVLDPRASVWAVAGGLATLVTTRTVSLASLAATATATLATGVKAGRSGQMVPAGFSVLALAIISTRHSANLRRLALGEEPRVSWGRPRL